MATIVNKVIDQENPTTEMLDPIPDSFARIAELAFYKAELRGL